MTLPDPVTAALIVKVNSCRPASSHFRCSILQRDCSAAGWAAQQTGKQRPGVSHAEHGGKQRDVSSSTFWKCLVLMMWCWTDEYHDRPGPGPGASCDQSHPQSQDPRLVTSHRHQLPAIWLRYPGDHVLANQKAELWSAADQRQVQWRCCDKMEYLSPMARDTRSEAMIGILGQTLARPWQGRILSGINDNNTSGNQICYMGLVSGQATAWVMKLLRRVMFGVTHILTQIPPTQMDQTRIWSFSNEFSGQDDLIQVTSDSRKDKNIYRLRKYIKLQNSWSSLWSARCRDKHLTAG